MATHQFTPEWRSFQEIFPTNSFNREFPLIGESTVRRLVQDRLVAVGGSLSRIDLSTWLQRESESEEISASGWLAIMWGVSAESIDLGRIYGRYPSIGYRHGCGVCEPGPEDDEGPGKPFQYTMQPAVVNASEWRYRASQILKDEMKAKQVDCTSLYQLFCYMELDYGFPEELAKMIDAGRFSAVFFLQVLRAVECERVELG